MFTSEVQERGRLLLLVGRDTLTGLELLDVTRAVHSQEASGRTITSCMILLDQVTRMAVSADDIRRLVEIHRQFLTCIPRLVLAIVAPKDDLFGMARMWEMQLGLPGWETRVFRARPEADVWLELIQSRRGS